MRRFKSAALLLIVTLFFVTSADANIFYTSSDYTNGSTGAITWEQDESFRVYKDLFTNLKGDSRGFTFLDHNGDLRAMAREYSYGPNDAIYVWDPEDWSKKPIINTTKWGASNIYAVASSGRYLYLVTYESYQTNDSTVQGPGEIIRVDMENGYSVGEEKYQYLLPDDISGTNWLPHGEAVYVSGDKVYALFNVWDGGWSSGDSYAPSVIVELDKNLTKPRIVELKDDGGHAGKNAYAMTYRNGKLYVACIGGPQVAGLFNGDIWQVDTTDGMKVQRILSWEDIAADEESVGKGMYGIQFTDDGTAFILTGYYNDQVPPKFYPQLFVSTESKLADKNAWTEADRTDAEGYSWNILWDEPSSVLWCVAGKNLEARRKDGTIIRTFEPNELGNDIISVALLNDTKIGGIPDGDGETGGGCDTGAWGFTVFVLLAGLCLIRRASARKSA